MLVAARRASSLTLLDRYIQVGLKGQPAILEGKLSKTVQPEECLWSLDNSAIEMSLQKSDRMSWWPAVIEGDPVIDTSKAGSHRLWIRTGNLHLLHSTTSILTALPSHKFNSNSLQCQCNLCV